MSGRRRGRSALAAALAGLAALVAWPLSAAASSGRAAHEVLPPARTAPVGGECRASFNASTLEPLFCADGRLNVAAWRWLAATGRHRHGWTDATLAVGAGASLGRVRSAVCADAKHDGTPVAVAAEQLAAVYYDWGFLDSPLFGISRCSPVPAPGTPPPAIHTPAEATSALSNVPLSNAGRSAVSLVQRFADDLVQHDWPAARAIEPGIPSDSVLAAGYAGLDASTVVVTGEVRSGGAVVLSGAYVAWEDVGGPRTSIYCTQWTVNVPAGRILSAKAIDSDLIDYTSGWVSPTSLRGVVGGQCVP